jgi:hypothetical protein
MAGVEIVCKSEWGKEGKYLNVCLAFDQVDKPTVKPRILGLPTIF